MAGGDCTAAGAAAISSSPSPNRDAPSIIDRLLQRTTSNKTKRSSWRSTQSNPPAPKEPTPSPRDEAQLDTGGFHIPAVAAAPQQPKTTLPNAGDITQPQPQQLCANPTAAATLEMPSAAPQPQLKKKASFRDRLKTWQKPPQHLEIVAERSAPRFVYEPKHAASDFSRLAVSPLSPSRQRLPSPMQPLVEDDAPGAPRTSQRRSRNYEEGRRAPPDEESRRRFSMSGLNHYSYTRVEGPFHASSAAAHVPVNYQPVAWSPGVQSAARREEQPTSASQPLSDYELFIARAEAEERERREQVLRSISQRSAAYSANRVAPDPHRQFAGGASSSVEKSDRSQQRSSGQRILGAGGGGAQQPSPREPLRDQKPAWKGHARQSSWSPSYATSGSAAEKILEKNKSSAPQGQPRRPPELPVDLAQPIVYGVDGEADHGNAQQPRTLRRQASLTQRIAQYIRPQRGASRIATLVE